MYLNKVFIIGNLTRDPEARSLPSGVPVTNFSVATNRRYKDKDGSWKEQTDYHNIVVFARQAETVAQYLRKGSMAMVEGRIQTRSWETPEGEKKYRTEIIADRVQFGPRGVNAGGATKSSGDDQSAPSVSEDKIEYPDEGINPEDIPF